MLFGNQASAGKKPTTPTIGTATDDGTGTGVSVAFTPSTYIGKGTITYTATSSPGSLTGTGSGSPITVSGLTTGTAYTFTVAGNTDYGVASDSSAASNSVTPASPSSFESIATINTGSVTSITFSSIPSTYKHLQIRGIGRGDTSVAVLYVRFNGDSGLNYSYHELRGSGSAAAAAGASSVNAMRILGAINYDASNPFYGASIINIIDYASTSKYKTMRSISGNVANVGNKWIDLSSGLWQNTSAINSITLFMTTDFFISGSTVALYGIRG